MGKRYWRERAHTRASPRVVNNTHVTRPVAVLPCKKGYIVLNDSQLERLLFAPETTIYTCVPHIIRTYIMCVADGPATTCLLILLYYIRVPTHLPAVHIILLFHMYIVTDVYNNNNRRLWMAATAAWWSFEIRVVGRRKCALVDIVFFLQISVIATDVT